MIRYFIQYPSSSTDATTHIWASKGQNTLCGRSLPATAGLWRDKNGATHNALCKKCLEIEKEKSNATSWTVKNGKVSTTKPTMKTKKTKWVLHAGKYHSSAVESGKHGAHVRWERKVI